MEKHLNKKIIKIILNQDKPVDFSVYTTISDFAAEALLNYKGDLNLSGLKTLSDKSAEFISKYEGLVNLDGLQTLTENNARILSRHPTLKNNKLIVEKLQNIINEISNRNLYKALKIYFEKSGKKLIWNDSWVIYVAHFIINDRKIHTTTDIFQKFIKEIEAFSNYSERTYAHTIHDFLSYLIMNGLIPGINKEEDFYNASETISKEAKKIIPEWDQIVDKFDGFNVDNIYELFDIGFHLLEKPTYKNFNEGLNYEVIDYILMEYFSIALLCMYESFDEYNYCGMTVEKILENIEKN